MATDHVGHRADEHVVRRAQAKEASPSRRLARSLYMVTKEHHTRPGEQVDPMDVALLAAEQLLFMELSRGEDRALTAWRWVKYGAAEARRRLSDALEVLRSGYLR